MKHLDWGLIPQEQLNDKLSRKFISGEKITVAQLFLHKGCLVPEHSHESEQICLVMSGSLRFSVEGKIQLVKSHQMIQIPSNLRHSVEALEDSMVYDIFSPIRQDWMEGDDSYLRK